MTDTDPERMALATAIFAARAAAFENEVEGDLYRMAGNYREAYAGVTAFRDELAFWGYTVTPLAPGPRAIVDGCICQKCADRGDECDYGAEPNHDECSLCERGRHVRERDREDEMEQES